jgi:hypothetical protein
MAALSNYKKGMGASSADCLRLEPYPELSLEWQDNGQRACLATPWYRVVMRVPRGLPERFALDPSVVWSELLQPVAHTPLSFVQPRPWVGVSWARRRPGVDIPLPSHAGDGGWDPAEVYGASRLPLGLGYDPLAAHSALRRLWWRARLTEGEPSLTQAAEALREGSPSAFSDFCRLYVHQNHHVTAMAEAVLSPALSHAPISKNVRRMIREERGHDVLMARCLGALGCKAPDPALVLPETQALMDTLRSAAATHPACFAILLDFFEAFSQEAEHPFAQVMAGAAATADAAAYLQRHRAINKAGNHDAAGFDMLRRLGRVGRITIASACQHAELLSQHLTALNGRLLEAATRRSSAK